MGGGFEVFFICWRFCIGLCFVLIFLWFWLVDFTYYGIIHSLKVLQIHSNLKGGCCCFEFS